MSIPAHRLVSAPLMTSLLARGRALAGSRRWQVAGLVGAIFLVNLLWCLRDRGPVTWDDAHYLNISLLYRQTLDHHGPVALLREVYRADPGRAPLLPLLLVPFGYFLPPGPAAGLALNLLLWPVLLLATGDIAYRFFGHRGRLLAILLLAPMPEIVGLSHAALQDFLLCTLATVTICLLLRSDGFHRLGPSLGVGVVLALGTLTKISFAVAVIVPLLVVAFVGARRVRTRAAESGWRTAARVPLIGFACTVLVALLPSLLWYLPNWAATRAYLHLAFAIQPGTVADPLSAAHQKQFAITTLNTGLSWPIGFLALAAGLLVVVHAVRARGHRHSASTDPLRVAILTSWAVLPYLAVAANSNQDPRYAVAMFPALAVIVAGWIVTSPWRAARVSLVALSIGIAVVETAQVSSASFRLPLVPENVAFWTPIGQADMQLAHGLAGARTVDPVNPTTKLLEFLESRSRGADGKLIARRIAILQLDGLFNGNNLPYYAEARGDPFVFDTLFNDAPAARLAARLKPYDFVLYTPLPATAGADRVAQLNTASAATQVTPEILALYRPDPYRVVVTDGLGAPDFVEVLEPR